MPADTPPVSCHLCGSAPADAGSPAMAGWMSERDPRRGTIWVCPTCAREYLRSVEARLDQEWW